MSQQAFQFFLERLGHISASERVKLSERVHVYLAGMLCKPITCGEAASQEIAAALAPRFARAIDSQDERELQRVGDTALLICGFWWQRLEALRRGPGPGYYEDIGQRAYLSVRADVFNELGDQFGNLAWVLALLWADTSLRNIDEITNLYGLWMRTHSRYARSILEHRGFFVNKSASS